MSDPQVLVVGAGPVGLTLAIDLGRRGVNVMLVERNDTTRHLPKMERCNARTMEFYRRLGIADRIRNATRFQDVPMDVFVLASFQDPPLLHLEYPSVIETREEIARCRDGSLPLEPSQLVSQYTLEAVLRTVAEATPNVSVRFNCDLIRFEQGSDVVISEITNERGEHERIESAYLVGCDGGTSSVRKALGIPLEGQGRLAQMRQIFFRSNDLFDRIPSGPGRHYYFPTATLVVQDDLRHFVCSTTNVTEPDSEMIVREMLGFPVDFEILNVGYWNHNLLVAERFRDRRVLLAGDSAHLVIPTGGLGMNTGAGDAIDLSWKLAGTLAGWGGDQLLNAYESERRQVALENRTASAYAAAGVRMWRSAVEPVFREMSPAGEANRRHVASLANEGQRRCHEMTRVELGYRYKGSPLIWQEPDELRAPDQHDDKVYVPSASPGSRLPHMWLSDGTALADHIGQDFTLLSLSSANAYTAEVERALRDRGVTLTVLRQPDEQLRTVYGANLLLLRPDMHVVWRGNVAHPDPAALAEVATGHSRFSHASEPSNTNLVV